MTPSVRPLLSALLCCVVAFGHAPAWLHVASCDGGCHGAATPVAQVDASCSHDCCHRAVKTEAKSDISVVDATWPADGHDSGRCVICQSLAGTVGVVPAAIPPLPSEFRSEPAVVFAARQVVPAAIAIAHPRGPPAAA